SDVCSSDLFGIARNAALAELRRRKRATPTPVEQPEDAEEGREAFEAVLRRTTVRDALAVLSPRERDLIALKFHAGLSNSAIARARRAGARPQGGQQS